MHPALIAFCTLLLAHTTAALPATLTYSPPEFASMFAGGAVLQRGTNVTVWGTSNASDIELLLDGTVVATAGVDASGRWEALLPPQTTSWWASLRVVDRLGHSTARVMFGEVVMCSGQSNMGMAVKLPGGFPSAGGFDAANGTAEAAAAGRYTGKIQLLTLQKPSGATNWNGTKCSFPGNQTKKYPGHGQPAQWVPCTDTPQWNEVNPHTIGGFSAVCWYSGKSLFERLKGRVPVGLMLGAVGGSPIEAWLPPEVLDEDVCGIKKRPLCDATPVSWAQDWAGNPTNLSVSMFFDLFIKPLAGYTVGSMVWDQAERDVHCFAETALDPYAETEHYACMEKELIRTWRKRFTNNFAFVTVQLPGYIGDCDSVSKRGLYQHGGLYSGCVPGVFNMRVQQDAGAGSSDDPLAATAVTYDLSCPFGIKTDECPHGSVHNENKSLVGPRVGAQFYRLRTGHAGVSEGPRAVKATAVQDAVNAAETETRYNVSVTFTGHGGLHVKGTQWCDNCCYGPDDVGDFDVSADGGATYVNGTRVSTEGQTVQFSVTLTGTPTHVRYTANQPFPQCAVYNTEDFPAFPFTLEVGSRGDTEKAE